MARDTRFRDDDERRRWAEQRDRDERGLRGLSGRQGEGYGPRDSGGRGWGGEASGWDRTEGWSGEDRGGWQRGDDWGGSRGADREPGGWRSRERIAPEYGQPDYGRSDRDDWTSSGGRSGGGFGDDRGGSPGSHGWGRSLSGRDRPGREEDRGFIDRATDEVASWFGDDDAERRRRMDARRDGEHRGRGPRSYRRSDDRIREDVNDRLTDDPHIDASGIDVVVENGEVTLSGTVGERFAKRHAEDLAESVSGVQHVQNSLRVQRDERTSSASGTGFAGGSTYGTGTGSTSQAGGLSTAGTTGTGAGATGAGSGTDRSRG